MIFLHIFGSVICNKSSMENYLNVNLGFYCSMLVIWVNFNYSNKVSVPIIKKLGSVLAKPLFNELLQDMYYKISFISSLSICWVPTAWKKLAWGCSIKEETGETNQLWSCSQGVHSLTRGRNLLVVAKILKYKVLQSGLYTVWAP